MEAWHHQCAVRMLSMHLSHKDLQVTAYTFNKVIYCLCRVLNQPAQSIDKDRVGHHLSIVYICL